MTHRDIAQVVPSVVSLLDATSSTSAPARWPRISPLTRPGAA